MKSGNHYQVLGLDLSAPPSAIAAALERLETRADALAYTSPERSRQLWEQIREIKRDLLSGPEARAAYLRQLREAPAPGAPVPRAAPAPPPAAPPSSHTHWPVVLGAAAVVVGALIVAALIRSPHGSPHRTHPPVAMVPQTTGPSQDDAFLSGHHVLLTWDAVPHAILYRLEIATTPAGAPAFGVFRHPAVTWLTTLTSYRLRVTGAQQYFWRVQPNVDGRWGRFSTTQGFAVSRPEAATPRPLRPANGSAQTSRQVRLCWRPVAGAIGYRLFVAGSRPTTVRATCARDKLPPGAYLWSVAALVRGVQVYTGPPSPIFHFMILEPVVRHSTRQIAARLPQRKAPARHASRPPRHAVSTSRRQQAHPVPAPRARPHSAPPKPVFPVPTSAAPPLPVPPQVAMLPPARPAPVRRSPSLTPPHTTRRRTSPPRPRFTPPHPTPPPPWGRPRPAATVTGSGGIVATAGPTPRPTPPPTPRPTLPAPPPPPTVAVGLPPAPTTPPASSRARPVPVARPATGSFPYRAAPTAPAAPRPSAPAPHPAPAGPGASVPTGPLRHP